MRVQTRKDTAASIDIFCAKCLHLPVSQITSEACCNTKDW